MNITVTLTADTALLTVLQALLNLAPAASVTTQQSAPTAVVETKEKPAAQEIEKKEVAMPSVNGKTITAITIEQIRALVKKKADEGKRDQIKTTLAEFGADKVTSLQQDQYTDFHTKLEAL
jgi:anaerobic ribonucleoside-triphosphate reductase